MMLNAAKIAAGHDFKAKPKLVRPATASAKQGKVSEQQQALLRSMMHVPYKAGDNNHDQTKKQSAMMPAFM